MLLAHLVEFHHNAKFLALVDQYPKSERARGFLTGVHYAPDGSHDSRASGEAIDAYSAPENTYDSDEVDYRPTLF